MNSSRASCIAIAAAIMAAALGVTWLLAAVLGRDFILVHPFGFGFDYHDLYEASVALAAGGNPYDVHRYVTPPFLALVNVPLTALPFDQARFVWAAHIPAGVLLSVFLMQRILDRRSVREQIMPLLLLASIVFMSAPFLFLLQRGNHDALAVALTCGAIAVLERRPWLAGLLLGIAIAVKIYPVLLLLPLAARRKWMVIGWAVLCLAVLVLVVPGFWASYVSDRLMTRSLIFRTTENTSLVAALSYMAMGLRALGLPKEIRSIEVMALFAAVLYGVALVALLVQDLRRVKAPESHAALSARLLRYFPFMVAMPRLAYSYELIAILPLLPMLNARWGRTLSASQISVLTVAIAGLVLTQLHGEALARVLAAPLAEGMAATGLLILLLTIAIVGPGPDPAVPEVNA